MKESTTVCHHKRNTLFTWTTVRLFYILRWIQQYLELYGLYNWSDDYFLKGNFTLFGSIWAETKELKTFWNLRNLFRWLYLSWEFLFSTWLRWFFTTNRLSNVAFFPVYFLWFPISVMRDMSEIQPAPPLPTTSALNLNTRNPRMRRSKRLYLSVGQIMATNLWNICYIPTLILWCFQQRSRPKPLPLFVIKHIKFR